MTVVGVKCMRAQEVGTFPHLSSVISLCPGLLADQRPHGDRAPTTLLVWMCDLLCRKIVVLDSEDPLLLVIEEEVVSFDRLMYLLQFPVSSIRCFLLEIIKKYLENGTLRKKFLAIPPCLWTMSPYFWNSCTRFPSPYRTTRTPFFCLGLSGAVSFNKVTPPCGSDDGFLISSLTWCVCVCLYVFVFVCLCLYMYVYIYVCPLVHV